MRIWIDASEYDGTLRVFGMTLLERLLRGILEAELLVDDLCIAVVHGAARPEVPGELLEELPLRFEPIEGDPIAALSDYAAVGDPVLALQAHAIVDSRVLGQMAELAGTWVFFGGEGDQRTAVLRLEPPVPLAGASWVEAAQALVSSGTARALRPEELDGYISMLRRDLAPYAFLVRDEAQRRAAERFLFWSNYKGSTDFMTRWVYPPFVWLMVRPLARWRVHPHWVTAVDIAAAFAAIPFFARGDWAPGLALAYLMSVLDSVDGKLARLTFTSSKLGEVLDHGLDIVHPPLWYLAWGWALGGQDPGSAPFVASLWMFGLYVADRVVAGLFKARVGRSIHGATPFDERMRTFISRRNVNLPIFTVALAIDAALGQPGWPVASACFQLLVVWQAVCLLFHAQRLLAFWRRPARP